jgi:methylmalonyl-CoA mutase N-terminal domain/subunit
VVGVNRYVTDSPPIAGLLRVDVDAAKRQMQRLERLRRERDGEGVRAALFRLEGVARGAENTVPAILECVGSYCTLGEICQVFRGVFGEQEGMVSF